MGAAARRGWCHPDHLTSPELPPSAFRRTLNNNNITSIPVSSFNHMPKLRTL